MTHISINSNLGLGLERAEGPVVVTDENGNTIGQFIPVERPLLKPEDRCPDSEEVVRAAIAESLANPRNGKTLADFWRDMGREP